MQVPTVQVLFVMYHFFVIDTPNEDEVARFNSVFLIAEIDAWNQTTFGKGLQ